MNASRKSKFKKNTHTHFPIPSHTHTRARANSFQFCRRLELLRSADRQANLACVAPGARRPGRRRFEVLATKPKKATSTQSCVFLNVELQAMLDDEFSIAMSIDCWGRRGPGLGCCLCRRRELCEWNTDLRVQGRQKASDSERSTPKETRNHA